MKPKLAELAARINTHLNRFERDPKINKGHRYDKELRKWVSDPKGTHDYYLSGAHNTGKRIAVQYVSYQGSSKLTREEAEAYLAWLDAGNVGTHFTMERAKEKQK